ncbi:MAG: Precorrin-8X methylmutase [Hyphomicrobiaceae bacterium hypho_1]
MTLAYLKDPSAIYHQSFTTIRQKADLSRFCNNNEVDLAIRVIHACGMIDIAEDIIFNGDVAGKTRSAINCGRPVFVDVHMVQVALSQSKNNLVNMDVRCTVSAPETELRAKKLCTTRSAAAVHGWIEHLEDSVVVIGNAPTALFALLELLDEGAPKPAAVFAFPVGFVGAIESKSELVKNPRGLNFMTVSGRRGGSAMAAAAFNAVWLGVHKI